MSDKTLGTLRVKLKAMTADFVKDLSKARLGLEKFAKTSKTIAKVAGATFIGMGAPLGYAIKLAGSMAEQMNVLKLAFGKTTPEVMKWSQQTAKAIGRSEMEIRGFAGDMQLMLTPMMGSADAASKLSLQLTQLAYDLGSLKEVSDEEAFRSLQAGMIGSLEPMLKFGVVMTQANLQTFALSRGIKKSVQAMSEQEKVALRFAFIMEKTKTAQGDAANTSGSFANTMKAVKGALVDLAVDVGAILLPAATRLAAGLKKLLRWFRELSPEIKTSFVWAGALATAFTGLAAGVGIVGAALPSVIDGIMTMGKGIAATTKLVWGLRMALLKTAAVATAAVGVIGLAKMTAEAVADPEGLKERLGIKDKDIGIIDAAKLVFKESFTGGFDMVFGPVADLLGGALNKLDEALKPDEVKDSTSDILKSFGALDDALSKTTDNIKKGFDFEDMSAELAEEIGQEVEIGAFGFDFDKLRLSDKVQAEFERAQEETAEAVRPTPDFKDAMSTAFTDIQGSLGTFSELAKAAEEGGKSGGVWGAIIAVVVRILQMTQVFQRVVGHFNMVVNTMVMALDRMLAPLAPLIELLSNGLIVLANFTIAISELSFGIEFITKAVGWVAEGLTKALDWIIEKWNNLVDGLAKLLGKIPGVGDKLKSMAEKLTLDYSAQARADYESMFGEGGPDFGGFAEGMDKATDAVKEFGESLTNVPQGYKVDLARFNAMDAEIPPMGGMLPAPAAAGASSTRIINNEVHIHGITDPVEIYEEIKRVQEMDNFITTGTTTRTSGSGLTTHRK